MGLKNKDLLGMKQLSAEEIMEILETAKTMKMVLTSGNKKTSHLQGKSVVTLFYENSTRTRLSFELASKYMGSASANISASGSSVKYLSTPFNSIHAAKYSAFLSSSVLSVSIKWSNDTLSNIK